MHVSQFNILASVHFTCTITHSTGQNDLPASRILYTLDKQEKTSCYEQHNTAFARR